MQLQNHHAIDQQRFVLGAPVAALESEHSLIAKAAGFDVTHGNQRLEFHGQYVWLFPSSGWYGQPACQNQRAISTYVTDLD